MGYKLGKLRWVVSTYSGPELKLCELQCHFKSYLEKGCPSSSSCWTYTYYPPTHPPKKLGLKWNERAKERILYSSFLLFPYRRTPSNTPDVSKTLTLSSWGREGWIIKLVVFKRRNWDLLLHITQKVCSCSACLCLGKALIQGWSIRKPTWSTALKPFSPTGLSVTEEKWDAGQHSSEDCALESNGWFRILALPLTMWAWAPNLSMLQFPLSVKCRQESLCCYEAHSKHQVLVFSFFICTFPLSVSVIPVTTSVQNWGGGNK